MRLVLALLLVLGLAVPAEASCFADYKAKKDAPLRLHYGVTRLPEAACTRRGAREVLGPRLAKDGWTLLAVLSIFGPEGLKERKASAGDFFLRY